MMISSSNETPFPLGRKQPNKSTREKGTQCKDATTGNKFTQAHKQYHILVLVWNHGKRTTLVNDFVYGTGILNLRNPKIQKARHIKPFLILNGLQESASVISFLLSYHFLDIFCPHFVDFSRFFNTKGL